MQWGLTGHWPWRQFGVEHTRYPKKQLELISNLYYLQHFYITQNYHLKKHMRKWILFLAHICNIFISNLSIAIFKRTKNWNNFFLSQYTKSPDKQLCCTMCAVLKLREEYIFRHHLGEVQFIAKTAIFPSGARQNFPDISDC